MTSSATLAWHDGQPYSAQFGDVYFSRDSGIEETRHVFLANNQLPERFAALKPGTCFTIGETGFGSGLNFLCAWQCFSQHAPVDAQLCFVSVEKYPLLPADLARALALWPELQAEADQLIHQYTMPPRGWHRYPFAQGRVSLSLLVGDACEALEQLDAQINAWFLDGFSPAKNPEMWNERLYRQMVVRSAPGASLATFTCAGHVRRGLQAAGFTVRKVAGFGSKREMIAGTLDHKPTPPAWRAPWYARPAQPAETVRSAVVVGGGIAGAASAWSLAIRGWQVTLLERHPQLAQEGSGNAQGILYARMSPHPTPMNQLIMAGYAFTVGLLKQLWPTATEAWQQCGVLQLPIDLQDGKRQQALIDNALIDGWASLLDQASASAVAGVALPSGGLFFPDGGWLHPASLVRALCQHPNIDVRTSTSALLLEGSPQGQAWVVSSESGPVATGNVLILAGSADTAAFDCTSHLPLTRIRGQITHLPASRASCQLKTVLCHEGYIAPANHGQHTLGASFQSDASDLQLTVSEHTDNLAMLLGMAPALYDALAAGQQAPATLDGRAAFRCTTPDYLPLIGPVATEEALVTTYAGLAQDASRQLTAPAPWIPGLYVNTGHGSRGLITGPLSGEILATWINNEPAPLPGTIMQAIHPNRFVLRKLMKGRR